MKIKWGMMMTDGRGKLGGQVASKNRAGAYVRTKVTPSNPQTQAQGNIRQLITVYSKGWSQLTEMQRAAWNAQAQSGSWDRTNIFGDKVRPTGMDLYISVSMIKANVGDPYLPLPPQKAEFVPISDVSLSVIAGAMPLLSLNLTAESGVPLGTKVQIQATGQVSPGKNYLKNLYRDLVVAPIADGENNITPLALYEQRFGALAVGRRIGMRVRQVLDGQVTPWIEVTAIVAEG